MNRHPIQLKRVLASLTVLLMMAPLCAAQDSDRSNRERAFHRLDRNGDDKVTREESGDAPRFERFDRDKDGAISLAEFRRSGQQAEVTVQKHLDLEYGKHPKQRLDVYAPPEAKRAPVMIYIHGGGWRTGDKAAVHSKPQYFAKRGWVFVSINYRFVPQIDILTQLQDSARAVVWVHDRISKYGGDPDRIHLMGHSAGAHHVAILGTNEDFLKVAGKELSIVHSVTELDTLALDVVRIMEGEPSVVYRQAFGSGADVWRKISPVEHLEKDKKFPAFFLVVADNHPQKMHVADAFQKKLQQNGGRCEFVMAPEHNHGSVNRSLGLADDKTTVALGKFLDSLEAKQHGAEQKENP